MPNMIRAHMNLKPLLRQRRRIPHRPRIEDQRIEPVAFGEEAFRGGADGRERGEVERDVADVCRGSEVFFYRGDGIVGFGGCSGGEVDSGGIVFGELEDGFFAEAGVS
jgi:hypothetical protein